MNTLKENAITTLALDVDRLDTLFPFYFAFNDKLKLIAEGKGLKKLLPSLRIRKKVNTYFTVEEGRSKNGANTFFRNIEEGNETILTVKFTNVQLKGMFIVESEASIVYFLGNPIIDNIEDITRLKLDKDDFSSSDTGLDQLFRVYGNSDSLRTLIEDKKSLYSENLVLQKKIKNCKDFFKKSINAIYSPIRNNISYAKILRKQEGLDEDLTKALHLIQVEATDARYILDRLEHFFQLMEQEAEVELIDASMIVDLVKNNLQNLIIEKRVTIENHCPSMVKMDFRHLKYIVQHLVENAILYNNREAPLIQLTCKKTSNIWTYRVSDNGTGINEKYLKQFFEPFTVFHPKEKSGIGLSLATCKMIVEHIYKGKIWVETEKGKGTSIFFSIQMK